MNKINFTIQKIDEQICYDCTICKEDATVADYIENLDAFLDEVIAPCIGCDLCCSQRIPLTLGDIYTYAGKEKSDIKVFLEKYAEIRYTGGAVDIKLRQNKDESCIFLDKDNQKCSDHSHRSLVCHSYICIPQTERARSLRETLIAKGEDAAAGALLAMGLLDTTKISQGDYPIDTLWQNKDFSQIYLKDLVDISAYQ